MIDSINLDEALGALQRRNYRLAEDILHHLIETKKSLTPELAIPLARALKELNKTDEAKKCLHDVLRLYPGSKRTHAVLGDMYHFTGEHDKAIDCYITSAIAETDDLPSPAHHEFIQDNLAVCYEASGNFHHAESIFRALVCRNPHNLRYAKHLYGNLIKQNREKEAAFFAKTFMPFWFNHEIKMLPQDRLEHENLYGKKIVIYGINPLYGYDCLARELYAWLRQKNLDVYCFVDIESDIEEFEGRPVYAIYDLLLEDPDSLLIMSLYVHEYESGVRQDLVQTMPIVMLGIQANNFLGCGFPISANEDSVYEVDICLGRNLKCNPFLGVPLSGFAVFGDMHNNDALKIIILGGSTTDPLNFRLWDGGIRPWAEILWEFLVGNGIPAVVYCGGVTSHGSHMELLKFVRDVLTLDPDIVVSYSGVNEFHSGKKFPFDAHFHGQLMQKIQKAVAESDYSHKCDFPWNFPNEYTNGLQSDKTAEQRYIDNIRTMHAISLEFSFTYISILQGIAGYGDSGESEYLKRWFGLRKNPSALQLWYSRMMKGIKELKDSIASYPYALDYSNLFFGKGRDHYFDQCHITTKGNRIIAQKVYEDFSAMGLLKRKNR